MVDHERLVEEIDNFIKVLMKHKDVVDNGGIIPDELAEAAGKTRVLIEEFRDECEQQKLKNQQE